METILVINLMLPPYTCSECGKEPKFPAHQLHSEIQEFNLSHSLFSHIIAVFVLCPGAAQGKHEWLCGN